MTPSNKICVSVAEPTVELCRRALEGLGFAEIRIDAMQASEQELRGLFGAHAPLIATCRPGTHSDDARCSLLLAAVQGGAAYVDVELDAPEPLVAAVSRAARSAGCTLIISHHDATKTPCLQELADIVDRCFARGAQLAKVACMVNTGADAARLLGLLDQARPLVVVGMGRLGAVTRVAAPLLGASFTYASATGGKQTAPGQLDHETLARLMKEMLR